MKKNNIYNLVYSKKARINFNSKSLIIGKWLFTDLLNKKKNNVKFYENNWMSKEKQLKDFREVKKIYLEVLKILSINLNYYHSKKYNLRQWELIIFFFLYHYIPVVYDRWNLIKAIKKKYKLKPVQIISYDPSNFLCEESIDVFDLIFSDEWNDWIISEIIKEQKIKYIHTKIFNKKKIFKRKFKKQEKNSILRYKKIDNKFFIINLQLPKYHKLKLNLSLNQLKFFYDNSGRNKISSQNKKLRKFKKMNSKNSFVSFVLKNIATVLPKAFLENFDQLQKNINYLNWPKSPKVIMTSYSHYNDEAFKIYAAQKIGSGTKLVILQHGHQGHHELCGTYYEKRICDNYITWGNRAHDKKTIPLFITTNIGKRILKKKPRGILVKITEFQLIPWKSTHAPREIESVMKYNDNLKIFLEKLDSHLRKNTTVKSYDYNNIGFVTNNIKKNFKDIKINKINRLTGRGFEEANDKNLIIETFNSTGFIELLSMNSPVILVTTKPLFYVKKEYKKYYDVLIKNKIIFFDAKEAARHINLNLSKIEEWWSDKKRQKGIKFFCENMCKYEKNNIDKLSLILKKIGS